TLLFQIPYLNTLLAIYLSWSGLAMGCLFKTGKIVLTHIENSPLPKAREALSWLVSRETKTMERERLRKTLADTLSENFTDALTAPFFWLLLLGPIGLWLYKVSSTMDSMWGYKTEAYLYLGWAAARSDDILALLPARISILAIGISDFLLRHIFPKQRTWQGTLPNIATIHKQAMGMPSPNSGCSMATLAWLCNARMAGSDTYFGKTVDKPWLGPEENVAKIWDLERLKQLFAAMQWSAVLGMPLLWLVFLFF
ncbi:MAG: cobalamin biosynthesis protein, partial [Desulfovibrio sp.]|nr:cobalamin biosynthesis protein [Desulfovibrio sp.]